MKPALKLTDRIAALGKPDTAPAQAFAHLAPISQDECRQLAEDALRRADSAAPDKAAASD